MKMIVAVVKPTKLEMVRESLTSIGIEGMTCSEVTGYGRQKGHTEIYRGAEYAINFVPKTRIEVVVTDGQLDPALKAICEAANTGKIGDGKVFVMNVEKSIRIRTGETDESAL
tara:strand:- start:1302 stop:1640 length:339 start_codon:yes stop_codon:yes gene_type:complete